MITLDFVTLEAYKNILIPLYTIEGAMTSKILTGILFIPALGFYFSNE